MGAGKRSPSYDRARRTRQRLTQRAVRPAGAADILRALCQTLPLPDHDHAVQLPALRRLLRDRAGAEPGTASLANGAEVHAAGSELLFLRPVELDVSRHHRLLDAARLFDRAGHGARITAALSIAAEPRHQPRPARVLQIRELAHRQLERRWRRGRFRTPGHADRSHTTGRYFLLYVPEPVLHDRRLSRRQPAAAQPARLRPVRLLLPATRGRTHRARLRVLPRARRRKTRGCH